MVPTKPLVRWTAGPPNSRFDDAILRRSILNFKSIYGDQFDYFLCLNGRGGRDFEHMGVEVILQNPMEGAPYPKGCAWKLYPPRIRPEAHEIFIDHDVVVLGRMRLVDEFLSLPDAFMYSQSPPGARNYGRFERIVSEGFDLNSGLFGIPPRFQFDLSQVGEWSDYFDDQGFVASVFCRQRRLIRLGLDQVWICDSDEMPKDAKAYHLVHSRRDESWMRFLRMTTI